MQSLFRLIKSLELQNLRNPKCTSMDNILVIVQIYLNYS